MLACCILLARMNPSKSADYFIKVNFRIVVDMKEGEIGNFYIIKNIFIMKNLTDFRKSVETGVDPCLRYYRNYTISLPFCFGKKN